MTLYDLFGYFLPGTIVVLAGCILGWSIWFRTFAVPIGSPPVVLLAVGAAASYFAGHLIQEIGNWFADGIPYWKNRRLPALGISEDAIFGESAENDAKTMTRAARSIIHSWGIELGDDKCAPKWIYEICDEGIAQSGVASDREIYEYRQGFYRGTSVALMLLAIALLVRLVELARLKSVLNIPSMSYPGDWWAL